MWNEAAAAATRLLLLPEPAGVPLLGAMQTQSGKNKSAQLKHPGLAMAKKSITQVMILRKITSFLPWKIFKGGQDAKKLSHSFITH